jgi:hypothetical protein
MDVQHGKGLSPWHPEEEEPPPRERHRNLLLFIRYGVPALIALTGIVIVIVVSDRQIAWEIGGMFFGAAIAVLMLNLFFRLGVAGDTDREREEQAREYFDRHGHWPGEGPQRQA